MTEKNSDSILFCEAHIRNLEIQIVKLMPNCEEEIKSFFETPYRENDIHDKFYFRKNDIHNYKDIFFELRDEGYFFKKSVIKKLKEYSSKHNDSKKRYPNSKSRFLEKSKMLLKKMEENPWKFDANDFERIKKDLKDDLPILHWGSLPIYKEEYMKEKGSLPEADIAGYYDDIYTFKDLLKWIEGETSWTPSFKGDCNLDQDMNFSVYSRRWGHRDCYRVRRTISGWSIQAIAINGPSKKDGTGKIIENLDHDGIFYPDRELKEAFTYLWNMADEREMTVEELAAKLQNIADWISEIEIAFGKYKPDWL